MKTRVILVNYKNAELTVQCLRALERGTIKPEKVYVIDNTPMLESRAVFETYQMERGKKSTENTFPIQFIYNEKNVGFAAACNQGARLALEEGFKGYIWLLNNDTEPEKEALERLLQKTKSTGAGITGSRIVDEEGNFLGGVGITHPKMACVSRPKDTSVTQFDYVEGSSFLISHSCIEKIGLLSEDYFLYFEESDYCYRARKAGLTLAWATDSVVLHRIGSSTGSENAKKKVPFFIDCLMIRNRIHFAWTNGFSKLGILVGLMISLALRIKRGQLNRVAKILSITASTKKLKQFIEENGGFYELRP